MTTTQHTHTCQDCGAAMPARNRSDKARQTGVPLCVPCRAWRRESAACELVGLRLPPKPQERRYHIVPANEHLEAAWCFVCMRYLRPNAFGYDRNGRRQKHHGINSTCLDCVRRKRARSKNTTTKNVGRLRPYNPRKRQRFLNNKVWCPYCKQYLPMSSFYNNKGQKRSMATYCIKCKSSYNKLFLARKREREGKPPSNHPPNKAKVTPEGIWCPDCMDYKHPTLFSKSKSRKSGWQPYCNWHYKERQDYYRQQRNIKKQAARQQAKANAAT